LLEGARPKNLVTASEPSKENEFSGLTERDPFKFIIYSGKIGEQTPQMAAAK